MRSKGRVFVGGEVIPDIKEALRSYAVSQGWSESEALRSILRAFFAFSDDVMVVRKEGENTPSITIGGETK